MGTFKLDDRELSFEPGDTIIRAAHRAGVDIPHYCWHPGLSVAANCRMCLVEVMPPPGRPAMMLPVLRWDTEKKDYVDDKKPKLQPACQFPITEGMEVKSQTSPHVERARSAVQEMLLLNHPVDCPICDQAGECRLQDYWLEHQHADKRMNDEPIHKPKAVVFGPTIVYDAERCIVCTRCIRFCDEVAKDPVLSLRERGNLNEIVLSPGRLLDHPYTLMTEYVCPVGALTAVDFRFKARVWFLRSARTVCQGCATGCNAYTDYDPRTQKVQRHRPRENVAVNGHWMCDDGMLDYRRVHARNRQLKAFSADKSVPIGEALDAASKILTSAPKDKIAVLLSAQHSNEDNFALVAFAQDVLGSPKLYLGGKPDGQGDDILRSPDKNPNRTGVEESAQGRSVGTFKDLARRISSGEITHLVALGADAMDIDEVAAFEDLEGLILLATHTGALTQYAKVVLPACTWAETDGTYVSGKGVAQESEAAIEAQGAARPAWKLVAAIASRMGHEASWRKVDDVRYAMSVGTVVPSVRAPAAASAE